MIVAKLRIHPLVRIVTNLVICGTFAGAAAYLSFLLAGFMWFAMMVGVCTAIVYLLIWLGSADDARNA